MLITFISRNETNYLISNIVNFCAININYKKPVDQNFYSKMSLKILKIIRFIINEKRNHSIFLEFVHN
jgi:hypothetical protein